MSERDLWETNADDPGRPKCADCRFYKRKGDRCQRYPPVAGEERLVGAVEIAQRSLQGHARHIIDPVDLGAQGGDLQALGRPIQGAARFGPVLAPEVTPLLQGQIVDEARRADPGAQLSSLRCGGLQSIAKSAMHRLGEHSTDMEHGT